jgi:dolichol kinase
MRQGATVCWLCGYRPPAPRRQSGQEASRGRSRAGAIVGFVLSVLLLVLAMPVAGAVALFCICAAPAISRGAGPPDALQTVILLVVGTLVVLTCLVAMVAQFGSNLRQ